MSELREKNNPKLSTPYKVQASILNKEMPSKEQALGINQFFNVRWLAGNRFSIPIAALLNRYYNIPGDVQYIFGNDYAELTNMRDKVSFIGINKEKKDATYQKLLDNIKRRYKVNESQAEEYFKLMNDDERTRIYHLYDTGLQK